MSASSGNGLPQTGDSVQHDIEAGGNSKDHEEEGVDEVDSDPFDIAQTKHVTPRTLRRWRVC